MSKPNAVICGEIDVAEEYDRPYNETHQYNGPINRYSCSLLIQFPDAESIRTAIKNKQVNFSFMGED